ncbi:hypothetical protein AB1Y20_011329 [Prymnesium parvum]|uniref:Uncharacterized protein n=1 Tax=Prymnesium parvum TaxID=97485 RepID=A0AB34IQ64_PRYPA
MSVLAEGASNRIVQLPPEPMEDWRALPDGGFKRNSCNMAAFLYEAELTHLYDTLETEELKELQARESSDGRLAFMAHLKSLGVEKLSDRQLFVNALGRAKRAGLLPGQSRAGGAPA